jgi:hypothetical protein
MKPNNQKRRRQGRLKALTPEERDKRWDRNERRGRPHYIRPGGRKKIPGEEAKT